MALDPCIGIRGPAFSWHEYDAVYLIQLPLLVGIALHNHPSTHLKCIISLISESYDELVIRLSFHRRLSHYFVRIYLPLILIVILSFGSFWIDYRSTPARTIMSTTIVLTVVTFIVSIQSSLPPTTSIRSVDVYSLSCFILVFATLIEFAFVQTVDIRVRIIERKSKEKVFKL